MSKDKRIPIHQAIELFHDCYDQLEAASLAAAEEIMQKEFGIGKQRFARYRERYLEKLGEEAEKQGEDFKKKLHRRLGSGFINQPSRHLMEKNKELEAQNLLLKAQLEFIKQRTVEKRAEAEQKLLTDKKKFIPLR